MQPEAVQALDMQAHFKSYLLMQGAGNTAHSGHTLWDHLAGVQRILQSCKAADYVCTAGLFHSVYGTQAFKRVTVEKTQRSEVRKLIGEKAESLVMAFCELPRPKLLEATLKKADSKVAITEAAPDWMTQVATAYDKRQFFIDLLALECANLAEQRTLHEFPWLAQHAQAIGMLDREGFLV